MVGKRFRRVYTSENKKNPTKSYLIVLFSLALTISVFTLLWSNTFNVETKSLSYPFGWLWHSNRSFILKQLINISTEKELMINIHIDGLSDNMVNIEDEFCINPHKFKYILNPKLLICNSEKGRSKTLFLVYIHTSPHHYNRRMLIRETWGNINNFDHIDIRTVFMCGATNNSNVQAALELEFDRYGDIVQENFVDAYRNLTYKAIMSLSWVSQYCGDAKLVFKADDDIFINIFKLVPYVESIVKHKELLREPLDRMIICNVWKQMAVIRNPKSKWYISKEELQDDYFKTYCSGSLYIFTPSLARSLFEVSRHVPFFWVDDYYVTGMLPERLKEPVSYESINKFYFLSAFEFMDKFGTGDSRLVVGHSRDINEWRKVWSLVTTNEVGSIIRSTMSTDD